ncbi:MAG: hypothetical protein JXA98_01595 [Methanosarcinaceae archaeon]|nr:hypothetical protein [Methanosarcinaceae archaeon]
MQLKNKIRRISGICVNDLNFYNRIAGKYGIGIYVRSRMFTPLIFLRLANIRIIKNVNITKNTSRTYKNIFLNDPVQLEKAATGYKFAKSQSFTGQVPQQYLRARGEMSDVSLDKFAPPLARFPQKPEGRIPDRSDHPMRTSRTPDSKNRAYGAVNDLTTNTRNRPENLEKERIIQPGTTWDGVTKDITTDRLISHSSKKEGSISSRTIQPMRTPGTLDSIRGSPDVGNDLITKTPSKPKSSTKERIVQLETAWDGATKDLTTNRFITNSSKKESLKPGRFIPPTITSGIPDSKRERSGDGNDLITKTPSNLESSTTERIIHQRTASNDATKDLTTDRLIIPLSKKEGLISGRTIPRIMTPKTSGSISPRMITQRISQPDTGSTETTGDLIAVHPARLPLIQRISTSAGILSPIITPSVSRDPIAQKHHLVRNEDVFSNTLNIQGPEARSLKQKIDRDRQMVLAKSQIGFQNGDVWQKDTSLEHMDTITNNSRKNISRKNSDLVLKKPFIIDEKNAPENINKIYREKNVEPEIVKNVSRRNVSERSTEEISIIADRVYKILETRIIIEKERRGLS